MIGGLALVGVSDFFAPSTPPELTSTSAPDSNHTTGQIVLGMSGTFQIKHYVVVNISIFSAGNSELKL